ncbi:MAG TPA: hypothetical protein VH277_06990 [Gemmatimonadaceae bacterium]|jgi:hypothetical protein|nr:hypothetical protein [Gemmatimonadaceae bacterium]
MYSEGEFRKIDQFETPSPAGHPRTSAAPESSAPVALSRVRRFIGMDGREWRVREVVSAYDRRRANSLIFDTFDAARRVRQYPPDWYNLTDAELAMLGRVTASFD